MTYATRIFVGLVSLACLTLAGVLVLGPRI